MHVLLIGLGNMGMKYLAKLEELNTIPVLCDIDPYKNPKKYKFYCHFGDVKEEIKRVIIAVKPQDHVKIAKEFLESGIPVLLEKPPAVSSKEFEEIAHYDYLDISEVELYSYVVRNYPEDIEPEFILIERLNKGKGYINPLWDLAWHDLYILQYLFGDVKIRSFSEGDVWELEGESSGIPFKIRVAWNYKGNVKREWKIEAKGETVILDFLNEAIKRNGEVISGSKTDKLKLMVKDFLEGIRREKSKERALNNLKILEKIT